MVEQFEALLNNADQRTTRDTAWHTELCGGNACWVGSAKADYGHDAPGQLLEYTIVSQNPADGAKFPNPNDTRGIPFIDFDVSYVDDAYLPVTMALATAGRRSSWAARSRTTGSTRGSRPSSTTGTGPGTPRIPAANWNSGTRPRARSSRSW